MNYIEKEAFDAYPVDICGYTVECRVGATPEPQDWNENSRNAFQEGFERALKCMHAWACGKYNESEIEGNKESMDAFQEMKREIMSMYNEVEA